jgi:hypothetical protein
MSILGKFTKQPIEVEVYSIQFVEDLSETDEITATYQTIARKGSTPWDRVVQADPYTILSTDDGKTIVGTANMTLPTGVSDGFRVNVSNKSQNSNITVGTFTVLARSAASHKGPNSLVADGIHQDGLRGGLNNPGSGHSRDDGGASSQHGK